MKATNHVFPSTVNDRVVQGLEARDYIAIQAMVGLSANSRLVEMPYEDIADMAYEQADAMIKQSEVRNEQTI